MNRAASAYGDAEAATYDQRVSAHLPADDAVAFVRKRVPAGSRLLELAAGTGRLAIPLAIHFEVTALDSSAPMLAVLRSKDENQTVSTVLADMKSPPVFEHRFDCIIIVLNGLYYLDSPQEQEACLVAASRVLSDDGCLIIEQEVINIGGLTRNQAVNVVRLDPAHVELALTLNDPIKQKLHRQALTITDDGCTLHPMTFRYMGPGELDLMAKLAGLRLSERYGSWTETPFTGERSYISVFNQRPQESGIVA